MTSIRDSNFSEFYNICLHETFGGKRFQGIFEARVEADVRRQLKHMSRELQVDEPAGTELHVHRTLGRLVARHVGAHLHRVRDDLGAIARHPEELS